MDLFNIGFMEILGIFFIFVIFGGVEWEGVEISVYILVNELW